MDVAVSSDRTILEFAICFSRVTCKSTSTKVVPYTGIEELLVHFNLVRCRSTCLAPTYQ